jgi:hypothetical protein
VLGRSLHEQLERALFDRVFLLRVMRIVWFAGHCPVSDRGGGSLGSPLDAQNIFARHGVSGLIE